MKIYNYFKSRKHKGNISQKFRLKNIDETRNYFIEEIKQNELISKKHKKVGITLNHFEHFIILASAITGRVSISAFNCLAGLSEGIRSSSTGLKTCAITAGSKNYE